MNKLTFVGLAVLSCFASPFALAQGGFGGQGQQGGLQREVFDRSAQAIQEAIGRYLDTDEIRNILTPGGFSEWRLSLKAGQMVFAEARSDAFDPAIEIADSKEKVQKDSDDRYPGDQRPLLMWRCAKDGTYSLRVRSYQGKAGGQFFLRFRVYDCVDLPAEGSIKLARPNNDAYLAKVPMKAGEIKQFIANYGGGIAGVTVGAKISPIGLPDMDLAKPLEVVFPGSILAPVDGDYYALVRAMSDVDREFELGVRVLRPGDFAAAGGAKTGRAANGEPTFWNLAAQKDEFLKVTTPEQDLATRLIVIEQPDISQYDLAKPEANPFFPQPAEKTASKGELIRVFPGRVRDGRVLVFQQMRDAKEWILVSPGVGGQAYTVNASAGAAQLDATGSGRLRVGSTDYWAFNGNVGDVMSFQTSAPQFAQHTLIRFPDLAEWRDTVAGPDQTTDAWNMVISRPGRYLVAMSCLGDGGAGDYTIRRTVFPPKEFGKGTPAQGEMTDTSMQVWRFSVKAGEPLLMRWKSNAWDYSIQAYDPDGNAVGLPLQTIGNDMQVAVLPARESKTYMLVITPRKAGAKYSIELVDLPKS